MTNASQEQDFHHRGSSRSDNSFYDSFLCEYYKHAFHNSNITTNHLEKIPTAQVRGPIYDRANHNSNGLIFYRNLQWHKKLTQT